MSAQTEKAEKRLQVKFMNNHYGQSQIFGRRVRFAVEPGGADGNGAGDEGTAGGSSGGDDGTGDGDGDGGSDEFTVEELKAQLAKEKAEKEKFKKSINDLTKKNKDLTDKTRKYMTDEQKAQADREARDLELEELRKEVRVSKYSKRLVGFGMTEAEADELAEVIPEMKESDTFFDAIGKFIEGVKKTAGEEAVQKLLKDRPDINAGNGDGGGQSVAQEKALAIAKRKTAARSDGSKATDYYKI